MTERPTRRRETGLRILAALIFLPVFLGSLVVPWSWAIWIFVGLAALIASVAALEISEIFAARHGRRWPAWVSVLVAIVPLAAVILFRDVAWVLGLSLIVWFLLAIFNFQRSKLGYAMVDWASLAVSMVYAGGTWAVFAWLLLHPAGSEWGQALILLAAAIVMISDSAAYFVGRYAGRIQLGWAVSPKKTLEGTIAGILLGATLGWILLLFAAPLWPGAVVESIQGWPCWVSLGLCFILAGTGFLGDLVESMLKRSAGVKEIRRYIPGHGSVLDVFDALMATAPVLLLIHASIQNSSL